MLIAAISGGLKWGGVQIITYQVLSREQLHVWDDSCGQGQPKIKIKIRVMAILFVIIFIGEQVHGLGRLGSANKLFLYFFLF